MPAAALALVLLAALLHAGWNYLAKSAHDTNVFLWWAILIGAIGYGAIVATTATLSLPSSVWLLYVCSIAAEVGYLITLVLGYRSGDLSLVYPLARGSAPILVAVWSALFLGERLPPVGYLGVALMVAGIFVVSWQPGRRPGPLSQMAVPAQTAPTLPDPGKTMSAREPGEERAKTSAARISVFWALASGVFVSIYSVLDKVIVNNVNPLVYNYWVYAGISVAWSPFVWLGGAGTVKRNWAELQDHFGRILLGSVMTVGAYVSVLVALTQTSASYVVAGRGTSVIVGALLGWLALREGFGWLRVLGSCLMVAGLTLIAFAQ